MWNLWLAGALALLSTQAPATDTTFVVPAGARIEIENVEGAVRVRTWDRNAVSVQARHDDRARVRIHTAGALVRIASDERFGPPRDIEFEVTIPAKAPLRIHGPFSDVSIDGAGGDVVVETIRGDVHLRGGNGIVELRSVEGEIVANDVRGRIAIGAVNEDIRLRNASGDVSIETVNGDIELTGIQSGAVVASTVNGDIVYDGTIRDQGRYSFVTHNGDVVLGLPVGANATVSVSTFNGGVDAKIPITLTELRHGERFRFTVGSGSARIDVESFNGTIHLRRSEQR